MRPKRYSSDKKIIITTDGKTTKARFYDGKKLIKEAIARCHPDDEFDFETGVRIAFDRLVGEKKPKFYSGKIVCVKSSACWYTVGKIYEVVNGVLTDNFNILSLSGVQSFDEINAKLGPQFIELVED